MKHHGRGSRLRKLVVMALMAVLPTGGATAQDACDRLLRKLIDDIPDGYPAHRIEGGLARLADLELQYGKEAIRDVDAVMTLSRQEDTAAAFEELLGNRTPAEAKQLFGVASAFGQDGRRAVTRATSLEPFIRPPGRSISDVLNSTLLTRAEKEELFTNLGKLMPDGEPPIEGTHRLLDKAGEATAAGNRGGQIEVRVNARIEDGGTPYGRLEEVDYDKSGRGGPNGETKIDTKTTTHAIQVKSRAGDPPFRPIDLGDGISELDLKTQVDEARRLGRRPVLASNAEFSDELARRVSDPSDPIYADGVGLGTVTLDSEF